MEFERKLDLRLVCSIVAAGILTLLGIVVETSMNVAFPTIMNEFGIGTSLVQWLTTGYLLATAIIIPVSAFLKKSFKMKNLFITAVCLFIVGTLLCFLAPNFPILLLGRIIAGCGTGLSMPLMFNIVVDQTPFKNMGLMMGIATMVTAVGPAVGPTYGGIMVDMFGWRMTFLALIPVLILALIMGVATIQQSSEIQKEKLDKSGFISLGISFILLVLAINMAGVNGWTDFRTIEMFLAAIVFLAIFIIMEKKNEKPLIHLQVFQSKCFLFSVLTLFMMFVIAIGMGYLVPNYAQVILGSSAMESGVILLPGCVLGIIMTLFAGKIYDRIGAKIPLIIGAVFVVIGLSLYIFPAQLTIAQMRNFYFVYTFGQALLVGNTMTHGVSAVYSDMKADANAVNNTVQQLSSSIGMGIITTVVAVAQTKNTDMIAGTMAGMHMSYVFIVFIAIVAFICTVMALLFEKKGH